LKILLKFKSTSCGSFIFYILNHMSFYIDDVFTIPIIQNFFLIYLILIFLLNLNHPSLINLSIIHPSIIHPSIIHPSIIHPSIHPSFIHPSFMPIQLCRHELYLNEQKWIDCNIYQSEMELCVHYRDTWKTFIILFLSQFTNHEGRLKNISS
jgi:hypothetical protein